ncbi:MAG: response regulator transcription factor, partial [Bacteroidota bacterium]
MTTDKILIALVEDHLEFRESMTSLLNSNEKYHCTPFESGVDFMAHIRMNKPSPSVVLMDINLPDVDGIECSRQIKEDFPKTLIMMCTVHEDDEKIFNALKAGASGYIL